MPEGIYHLPSETTVDTLRAEYLYTYGRLRRNRHVAALLAPTFQAAFGKTLDDTVALEIKLTDASILAIAGRDEADDNLDPVMLELLGMLLHTVKGDRTDPHYRSYAGNESAAEIVRPILGPELDRAEEYLELLAGETDPRLKEYEAPLTEAVAVAKEADDEVTTSEKNLAEFRLRGARPAAIEALNKARGDLYGKLINFRHDHPELRLPPSWPASFFRKSTRAPRYGATVAQIKAYLARLDDDRKGAEAALADAQAKEAARATAKEQRAKAREELAALRKQQRETKAQAKALEAEAKKKLK